MGGERWSTARAFLRPAMNRPNLHVIMNAHVTKVSSVLPEVHMYKLVLRKEMIKLTFITVSEKYCKYDILNDLITFYQV